MLAVSLCLILTADPLEGIDGKILSRATAYFENSESMKDLVVGHIEEELRVSQARLKKARQERDQAYAKEQQAKIKECESTLEQIRSGSKVLTGFLLGQLVQVGKIGYLFDEVKVVQVVDKSHAIIDVDGTDLTFWLSNIDTSKLFDGASTNFQTTMFEVIGNKQYENLIGGTKTVLELKAIDSAAEGQITHVANILLEQKRKLNEPPPKEKKAKPVVSKEEQNVQRAEIKLKAAKRLKETDATRARALAKEAMELAPESDVAKEAREFLKEVN